MLNLLPPMIQHWLTSTIIIQNNWSILHTDEDLKKLFLPTTLYKREKCLKEILSPYFHLILIKLKVQSVVAINVISVRFILYLITNLSAGYW